MAETKQVADTVISASEFQAVVQRLPVNELARVTRDWDPEELGEALAGTTPETQEHVYEAMRHHAERRIKTVQKTLAEASGKSDGTRARKRIFAHIRELEGQREIYPVLDR